MDARRLLYCMLFAAAIICLPALRVFADDDDEDEAIIAASKLPASVRQAVKKAFPEAKILRCEKEKEGGKLTYEIKLKSEGREAEIELDSSGKILEREEEIEIEDLPYKIVKAAQSLVPGGKLVEAEREIEDGKISYEVEVRCKKVTLELKFAGNGKLVRIKPEVGENEEEEHERAERSEREHHEHSWRERREHRERHRRHHERGEKDDD